MLGFSIYLLKSLLDTRKIEKRNNDCKIASTTVYNTKLFFFCSRNVNWCCRFENNSSRRNKLRTNKWIAIIFYSIRPYLRRRRKIQRNRPLWWWALKVERWTKNVQKKKLLSNAIYNWRLVAVKCKCYCWVVISRGDWGWCRVVWLSLWVYGSMAYQIKSTLWLLNKFA